MTLCIMCGPSTPFPRHCKINTVFTKTPGHQSRLCECRSFHDFATVFLQLLYIASLMNGSFIALKEIFKSYSFL